MTIQAGVSCGVLDRRSKKREEDLEFSSRKWNTAFSSIVFVKIMKLILLEWAVWIDWASKKRIGYCLWVCFVFSSWGEDWDCVGRLCIQPCLPGFFAGSGCIVYRFTLCRSLRLLWFTVADAGSLQGSERGLRCMRSVVYHGEGIRWWINPTGSSAKHSQFYDR